MKPSKTAGTIYRKVARKVLAESLGIKKGDAVTVETWSNSLALATAFSLEAKRMGAVPIMLYEDEDTYVLGIRVAPKEVIGAMGKHEYSLLSSTDAYVFMPGPPIASYSKTVTRQEYIDSTRYNDSWYKAAEKAKLRGARLTTGYIGTDMAEVLGKTVDETVGVQLKAALVDFGVVDRLAKGLAAKMKDAAKGSLKGPGTDLAFEFKGELEVQDGRTDAEDVASGNNVCYVPPGFVYKEFDRGSVNGRVALSPTLTRFGMLRDATVEVKEGAMVNWRSGGSPEVLRALEAVIPEKSRVLYGMTVGVNPEMRFGYGQDRFPAGSIGLSGPFAGIVRGANLKAAGASLVRGGAL
ncbi:MAG TPA: hypothetical protein VMS77_05055 [Conexivisphaerales archaeon]|nr:hypothetical protein [Conexivisphaerales archaeon]